MKRLGDKIIEYKRPDLERQVNSLLRSIPVVNVESLPVAIEVIFDSIPGVTITLEPMELLAFKFKIEAMVLAKTFMHRDLKVVVDKEIMDGRDVGRYHMALAEEIGHIQLHRAVMLDISEFQDFVGLQTHARWKFAERDAKYYGRALMMPQRMLEKLTKERYEAIVADQGFIDTFQFYSLLEAHLAVAFQAPPAEVRKRLDEYIGGLRGRIEMSFATRSLTLANLSDDIRKISFHPAELTDEQLFGIVPDDSRQQTLR